MVLGGLGCLLAWVLFCPETGRQTYPEGNSGVPAPAPAHLKADVCEPPAPAALGGPAFLEAAEPSGKPRPNASPRPQKFPRILLPSALEQANLGAMVKKYAAHYGLDESLVWAVIRQESGFNPAAVSPKGAMGLMQLMPATAVLVGVQDPFNVEENIAGGVKYLKACLNRFDQDVSLALAAYNAGPENVAKYQGCPPFSETKNYVAAVLRNLGGQPPLQAGRASQDAPTTAKKEAGLPWRIPAPRWKIAKPQYKIPPPRWKGGPT
ncbi:MAG: lytic transglycosylase domain-containing protein [Deltaproteobacteria bacterium]|nr:lytic transglycosylase domain-containing protein [Deltaproteobacteria bacterium]